MYHEGPALEPLMSRLAAMPLDFQVVSERGEPVAEPGGGPVVEAVVWDTIRRLGDFPGSLTLLRAFDAPSIVGDQAALNRIQLVLMVCWLLADEWFAGRAALAGPALDFLGKVVLRLAESLNAGHLLQDADRREELVRHLLAGLRLRPAGETEAQAADRLQTLDSAERLRVLRAAARAEARAREIREAMARAAAQEAANRYGE